MAMKAPGRLMAGALLAVVLALAGCTSADGTGTPTTAAGDAPATTEAPDTTAPEPTEAPEDGDSTEGEQEPAPEGDEGTSDSVPVSEPAEVPVWAWVVAGLVLIAAVAWMAGRSGGRDAQKEDEAGTS